MGNDRSELHANVKTHIKTIKDALGNTLVGEREAFKLYDTYGFPLELMQENVERRGSQTSISRIIHGGNGKQREEDAPQEKNRRIWAQMKRFITNWMPVFQTNSWDYDDLQCFRCNHTGCHSQ